MITGHMKVTWENVVWSRRAGCYTGIADSGKSDRLVMMDNNCPLILVWRGNRE